ncbi:hypothetical protein ACFX1T_046334 [Malus domestica]
MTKAPAAKTLTARDPTKENLFTTAPPGAGAGSSPLTEEGEISGDSTGADEGGEGGELAIGAVEGAFSDEVLDEEGAVVGGVLDGEGVAAGGEGAFNGEVLDEEGEVVGVMLDGEGDAAGGVVNGVGEDAALGGLLNGVAAGDLDGDDAGDCAPVEATKRAAIRTRTTLVERAIVRREPY